MPSPSDPGFNLQHRKKEKKSLNAERTKHPVRTPGFWVLGPSAARGIMQALLAVIAWMASSVSSASYTASTLPDIADEDFIKKCVQIHNQFRSKVNPTARNMLYMSWDPALARIAKAWAKSCRFAHNPQLKSRLHPNFTVVGENIWTGSLFLFSASSAISDWYNEIKDYDFSTRRCTNVCGHYTQIVTRLAVQCNFALEFLTLKAFLMEHISYATMDQEETTQRGHISEEPLAVIVQKMTGVSTISALTHRETLSHVTTLLTIQNGPYIYVTDTHLSFSLLNQYF
ncbi:glioma pathogenesis-related protein 1 isoform X2 [Peromyscus californicus insignis]|uniref:glioma pathogenesis-related protein 1 isoform X2 n=1 Tax=Peromyscus californicus insignis TaxID=564181 RepID=UPI0022A7941E|nr:glioma pathogenesis-related protein 1 isoform X2 [Peromyscus californicus insignis]